MIPSDLAARLRMLTEATLFERDRPVDGTTRVREIQGRFPDLSPGQRFTAVIDRALPDGTFRAVVAGRNYTLALNHPAAAGDTLDLVVTETSPKAVFAQLATPLALGAETATRPALSATGRLIGFLLTGQPAVQPATLAAGKPLLDAPPGANGAALAPALREAIAQSGLFYESHQSQWLAGKIDTNALLQEPQGRQALPSPASAADNASAAQRGTDAARPASANFPASPAPGGVSPTEEMDTLAATTASARPIVPDRLMPIVHQQLDAMATQNYVWQGQAWPGQAIEWEIEDPQRERTGDEAEPQKEWNTTLRLTLPRLGSVEARLVLTPAGVAMRLLAEDEDSVSALAGARQALDTALEAANVPLTGFVAERNDGRQ